MNDNVKRALEDAAVTYRTLRHKDFNASINAPADFAKALNYDVSRVTKSLLVRATDQSLFAVVVLPSDRRLNMSEVATLLGAKRIQMASRNELAEKLGFPPTGVAPIAPTGVPVFLDCSLMDLPSLLIGSGEVGVEIELSPGDLQRVSRGVVCSIT